MKQLLAFLSKSVEGVLDISLRTRKIIQIDVVQFTYVDGKWSYVKVGSRVIGKVPQREITRGFGPSLRKMCIKSSLIRRVLKHILKVG